MARRDETAFFSFFSNIVFFWGRVILSITNKRFIVFMFHHSIIFSSFLVYCIFYVNISVFANYLLIHAL